MAHVWQSPGTGDCQSLASLTGTITHAPPAWIAQNGPMVPGWNQRQLAQNVRVGNNIYYRLWGWQVHELGSNLDLSVLGQEYIVSVHIVMNTAQRQS